jgi:hypothetical protein
MPARCIPRFVTNPPLPNHRMGKVLSVMIVKRSATTTNCACAAHVVPTAHASLFRSVDTPLLTVPLQHRLACPAQSVVMLLETPEHGEVPLVQHGAAVSARVAAAGLLILRRAAVLRLGECRHHQRYDDEPANHNFVHYLLPRGTTIEAPATVTPRPAAVHRAYTCRPRRAARVKACSGVLLARVRSAPTMRSRPPG